MILSPRHKTAEHPVRRAFRPSGIMAQDDMLCDSVLPVDAGMLVLSSTMHILRMNTQARALMARLGLASELWPYLSPESMPAIVSEFCNHLLSELHRQAGNEAWTALELRRVCHMVTPALLLRGFAMPEVNGRDPRMILILQPCHS